MKNNAKSNPYKLKTIAVLTLLSCLVTPSGQAAIVITTFGNDAIASSGWSYDSATSILSGSQGVGDVLYNASPLSLNLSSVAASVELISLGLTGLLTTNPGGDFDVTLNDSEGLQARWIFSWGSFQTSSTVVTAGFSSAQTGFDLTSISEWNLGSNGSGDNVNATFTKLEAIPEPSTGAMMLIGAAGLVALRRLRKI